MFFAVSRVVVFFMLLVCFAVRRVAAFLRPKGIRRGSSALPSAELKTLLTVGAASAWLQFPQRSRLWMRKRAPCGAAAAASLPRGLIKAEVGRVAWLQWRAPSGGKRAFGCGAHVERRDVTFTTAADERHSLSICPFPHVYLKPR